jgi:hypothetical protein
MGYQNRQSMANAVHSIVFLLTEIEKNTLNKAVTDLVMVQLDELGKGLLLSFFHPAPRLFYFNN